MRVPYYAESLTISFFEKYYDDDGYYGKVEGKGKGGNGYYTDNGDSGYGKGKGKGNVFRRSGKGSQYDENEAYYGKGKGKNESGKEMMKMMFTIAREKVKVKVVKEMMQTMITIVTVKEG